MSVADVRVVEFGIKSQSCERATLAGFNLPF